MWARGDKPNKGDDKIDGWSENGKIGVARTMIHMTGVEKDGQKDH